MSPVACTVTRAEMRARRSREKHLRQLAEAQTPEQMFAALCARGWAILARGDAESTAAAVEQLAAAMNPVFDNADREYAQARRRTHVRSA